MKITVVSVGRSDYGILRPLIAAIANDPDFRLSLLVGGAHVDPIHGDTRQEIVDDGVAIDAVIDCSPNSDSPEDIAIAMAEGARGFAEAYHGDMPDCLVVLGDRFEALAAITAAQPFLIPIAHIGGGAITEGSLDDGFRHAATKLSHLHFVETDHHAAIVRQLGESPDRIVIVGALGLDNIASLEDMTEADLGARFGLNLKEAPYLITIHPETNRSRETERLAVETLAALDAVDTPMIFTHPNADQGGEFLRSAIRRYAEGRPEVVRVIPHFGARAYFSLMRRAAMMIGNSSSGIIEAGALGLPVVNIGNRQNGRVAGANVHHCATDREAIAQTIQTAAAWDKSAWRPSRHPYGQGRAADLILNTLKRMNRDSSLEHIAKKPIFRRL